MGAVRVVRTHKNLNPGFLSGSLLSLAMIPSIICEEVSERHDIRCGKGCNNYAPLLLNGLSQVVGDRLSRHQNMGRNRHTKVVAQDRICLLPTSNTNTNITSTAPDRLLRSLLQMSPAKKETLLFQTTLGLILCRRLEQLADPSLRK